MEEHKKTPWQEVRAYARLIGLYFKLNLSGAMAYRATFFMQAGGMMLSNAFFIFFWWLAFSQLGGSIGGYGFNDVMFIWAAGASAFGLSFIVFGNQRGLSAAIIGGEMDVFMLQPKSVPISMLCARTSLSAWGDFFYGIILMAATQGGDAMAWIVFLCALPVGALLLAGVSLMAHSLTFYLGNAGFIGSMATEFMVSMTVYPLGIYRGLLRALMYTLLPAAFIVHIPLSLARDFNPWLFLGMLAGAAAYCALGYWVFLRGIKRYESGNLIVTRM